jgi:hypothetical protein
MLSKAEYDFCMHQKGLSGTFMDLLIKTMFRADSENLMKLSKGYPELVNVVFRYQNESGYWQDLTQRWNKEYPNAELL